MTTSQPSRASEDTVQHSIRFPASLRDELLAKADADDRSLSGLVIRLCREGLTVLSKPDRVELEVPDGDGNGPLVELVANGPVMGDGPATMRVLVEGVQVPYLEVTALPPGTPGGLEDEVSYTLSVDHRFGTTAVRYVELWGWVWIMAQAMAVSSGLTCHGPNAHVRSVHAPEPLLAPDWAGLEELGMCGHTYETTLTFLLPRDDMLARQLRDVLASTAEAAGARDVCTRLISLDSMVAEPSEWVPQSTAEMAEPGSVHTAKVTGGVAEPVDAGEFDTKMGHAMAKNWEDGC